MSKKCNCCLSNEISCRVLEIDGYSMCRNCGLLFNGKLTKKIIRHQLIEHYSNIDPHENVANSKRKIFENALDIFERKTKGLKRQILDVGCGFGYFMEMANNRGWNTYGVEISEKAVRSANEKLNNLNVFHGTLNDAKYHDNLFDAITLWDVLVEIDDPFAEMKECFRILKENGKIGVRVRNLFFQKIAYSSYSLLKKLKLESIMKKPYVFHKYCFSRKSIYLLLERAGFQNICIRNSPLTDGDPYKYVKYHEMTNTIKYFCKFMSDIIYWVSFGRFTVGPSLLIWAEKPSNK
jgi:2-polyprenyl-3-methyl-5-hydroxy-6-metoxy-1,4-benzoquinol methylase